jgi:hypothetical protein
MSFLREAWERAPLLQRYPPHARLTDHEPWSGREDRIARIYADTRELADILRQWRAVDPQHPDVEKCQAMFVHLHARWKALFASWRAQGLAN